MARAPSRWMSICFLLGLLLPLLVALYSHGAVSVPYLLEQRWSRHRQPRYDVEHEPVSMLRQAASTESQRLSDALRRDKGNWDANHPRRRLLEGLRAYQQYGAGRKTELNSWRAKYKKLPRDQRTLIDRTIDYTGKLDKVQALMAKNAVIAEAIVDHGLAYYGVSRKELEDYSKQQANSSSNQRSTVMYALKHFVRDWSSEGVHEREPTFPCILHAIQTLFRPESRMDSPPRVLVPGAGLGRLAHEIAELGNVEVVTNEWAAAMNLAYRWLRSLTAANTFILYPHVDWWSHRATTSSLLQGVAFPDAPDLLQQDAATVELAEGDFTTALKHHDGTFDAIVTYFFIDTARNIFAYLQTIHALLKPGGIWVNTGPLLYGSNPSIQLSLDEVIALAEKLGFVIVEPGADCGTPTSTDSRLRSKIVPYNADPESLSRNAYLAQHWVARKLA